MFKLSRTLSGHSQDVKSVAALPNGAIFSGSRDTRALIWKDGSISATVTQHSHFVNAVAACHSRGLIATAGADKLIYVFSVESPAEPLLTLIGHSENVCSLAFNESNGALYSASWDKTAKIWIDGSCIETLQGHTQAVWAVLPINESTTLTGTRDNVLIKASADKTIKKWQGSRCVQTITGHSDVVRSLALLPYGFASCSNDATVRVWSMEGELLQELSGHTSFIYQVKAMATGELVSCGEDRTVRVWKDGQCIQTILHPCVSIWTVDVLTNGDIVSGGSDASLRIFSREPSRQLPPEELKVYDELVSSQAIPSGQVGDIDKSKLSDLDALKTPGKKDQEVKMVRNGTVVEAHQWSAASGEWIKIGEVVDAVGSSRKQIFEGKEYDYVFDVDLGDGALLKLPYNANENPYQAAQDFIHRNELSQEFLDQIANFILKNTQGQTIGTAAPQVTTPYSSSTAPTDRRVNLEVLPLRDFSFFRSGNIEDIRKKIKEFDSSVSNPLTLEEWGHLNSIQPGTAISPEQAKVAIKVSGWSDDYRFPGIDLLRLVCATCSVSKELQDSLVECVRSVKAGKEKKDERNILCALRLACNLFAYERGYEVCLYSMSNGKVFDHVKSWMNCSDNRNVQIAYATFMSKYFYN